MLENKTDAVGTVRCNRKNLSQAVNRKKLKKRETVKQFKGKVMHMKWRDKKDVNMLSTIYEGKMEEVTVAEKEALKPTVCIRYKIKHMPGVHLIDQITSCPEKCKKILQENCFQTHQDVHPKLSLYS